MKLSACVDVSVLSAIVLENEEDFYFSSVIDSLSEISDTMQNLWWLFVLMFTILVLAFSLFSIKSKANKYTRKVIQRLINDGKYIPGVFVELNDSKEILRYFIYSKKWKKRLIGSYNFVYDNAYGDILRKACDNTSMRFRLKRRASQKEVMDVVNAAYELHDNFRKSDVEFKSDYKESHKFPSWISLHLQCHNFHLSRSDYLYYASPYNVPMQPHLCFVDSTH